jgi:hypothetical protein
MARAANSCDSYRGPMACRQAGPDTNALGMWTIARRSAVGDVEILVSRPRVNTRNWREENQLFEQSRTQLFCLGPLAFPTARPGGRNPRKLGTAN